MALVNPFSDLNSGDKQWVNHISKTLKKQFDITINTPLQYLFQIPQNLTGKNMEAYVPQRMGIGSDHHLDEVVSADHRRCQSLHAVSIPVTFPPLNKYLRALHRPLQIQRWSKRRCRGSHNYAIFLYSFSATGKHQNRSCCNHLCYRRSPRNESSRASQLSSNYQAFDGFRHRNIKFHKRSSQNWRLSSNYLQKRNA